MCENLTSQFFGYTAATKTFFPLYTFNIELWDKAINDSPCSDKKFILQFIKLIAESEESKFVPRLYDWIWLIRYCDDRLKRV